jgi:hypothetical protein
MSAEKTLTEFEGVLVTIRSKKSFLEVTKAIAASLQRFSVPNPESSGASGTAKQEQEHAQFRRTHGRISLPSSQGLRRRS